MESPAYVNHGQWVADCPAPGCGDARALFPQDPITGIPSPTPVYLQQCANGHEFRIDAPPDEFRARIEAVLADRLSAKRRNWFPRDHPLAITAGWPHGQSVAELRQETERGEAEDGDALARRRADLLGQMKKLGVTPEEALNALKGV